MLETASTGALPYRLISAATTNATLVKGTPGRIFSLTIANSNAALRYVKFYNLAVAPTVGTSVPTYTFPIQTLAGLGTPPPIVITFGERGVFFSAGIGLAITGAQADNDTTAVAAGDVVINMTYL